MTFPVALADTPAVAGPELTLPVWQTLFALIVVLALLGGLAWAMRKGLIKRRGNSAIGIEAALALGERRSLVIVTVEGRRLLLGLTPAQVTLVTELKPPATFEQAVVRATGRELSA